MNSIKFPIQTFEGDRQFNFHFRICQKNKKKLKYFMPLHLKYLKIKKNNIFNEKSEIGPRTPYGISKAAGLWLIQFIETIIISFVHAGFYLITSLTFKVEKFCF